MRYGTFLLVLVVAFAGCARTMRTASNPQPFAEPCGSGPSCATGMCGPGMTGPGVGGPGPGVMMHGPGMGSPAVSNQVAFVGPDGMLVAWDVSMPGQFDSEPLVCPGRYNFPQAAIYRLKLSNIPSRPGVELYPTLEIGPSMPRTQAFLAHNAMPVQLTDEDFDQVLSGNFVTKVIYLPDPEYQELALAGVETLVSTRLDPGVDPIVEADRRGSIMGIVRLGNKDFEIPGEGGQGTSVVPASYAMGSAGGPVPMMAQSPGMQGAGWVPSNYISGVTGPQYGIPITATNVCLPGPPHIPAGAPAGPTRKHVLQSRLAPEYLAAPHHVRPDRQQYGQACAEGACQ